MARTRKMEGCYATSALSPAKANSRTQPNRSYTTPCTSAHLIRGRHEVESRDLCDLGTHQLIEALIRVQTLHNTNPRYTFSLREKTSAFPTKWNAWMCRRKKEKASQNETQKQRNAPCPLPCLQSRAGGVAPTRFVLDRSHIVLVPHTH
jgi:hypothetical protein